MEDEKCSNCLTKPEETDITEDSKKILSCIKEMNEKFGIQLVVEVLKGANTSKVRQMNFDTLSSYGILSQYSKDTIKEIITFLITEGYIYQTKSIYPVLRLRTEAQEILINDRKVVIKRKIEKKLLKVEK